MLAFDPNASSEAGSGIFGLPHKEKDAALVIIPVPWEATTSYGGGASKGPSAILKASGQIDLFDGDVLKPYEPGIFLRSESAQVRAWNKAAKTAFKKKKKKTANELGAKLNGWVYNESRQLLQVGKIAAILGGDHSVPYGAFQAAGERHGSFGLLHFDAHLDMRDAYEGFAWSHASIMRNAMHDIPQISKIVQVGIRDFCEQEYDFVRELGSRAKVFYDRDLAARKLEGCPWSKTTAEMLAELPEKIWISFDIDGLDPMLCPHTGTPVPGGLQFQEVNILLGALARSGRKILGFDLVEVAPAAGRDEWDANVGMRLLYKLAAWTFVSRGLCRPRGLQLN